MFDSNSLASGEPGERDVFLEQVFEWDEENMQYNTMERDAGAWVSAAQIRTIRFFGVEPPGEKNAALAAEVPNAADSDETQANRERNDGENK